MLLKLNSVEQFININRMSFTVTYNPKPTPATVDETKTKWILLLDFHSKQAVA